MAAALDLLPLYLHVARASELRRQPLVRDKLLVLAGAAATEAGLPSIAALCRQRVLANNPGHLLRRHPTFAAALADERFAKFHAQLAIAHPREKLEHILTQLGVAWERERDLYYTDEEYATALLGKRPEDSGSTAASVTKEPPETTPAAPRRRAHVVWAIIMIALMIGGLGLAYGLYIARR